VAVDSWEQLAAKAGQSDTQVSPQSDSAPTARRRAAELVIVLVEPSRTQANIIRKYIQQLGIDKVHTTGSGKQALDLARENHANAILTSMHLSDMTGIQLVEALHATPDCGQAGIILASSGLEPDEKDALARAERAVLMYKPFDLKKLAEALATATGTSIDDILREVPPASDTLISLKPRT
jgi:two-component system chemotaxis response regulator CheY